MQRKGNLSHAQAARRTPLDVAIEFVEEQLSENGKAVLRSMLQQQALHRLNAFEASYVDHSLKVMIHAGLVKRCHVEPGVLAYEATTEWPKRKEVLAPLKSPKYVKRFRPRNEAYREAVRLGLPYPKPEEFEQGLDLRKHRVHHRVDNRQQCLVFEGK